MPVRMTGWPVQYDVTQRQELLLEMLRDGELLIPLPMSGRARHRRYSCSGIIFTERAVRNLQQHGLVDGDGEITAYGARMLADAQQKRSDTHDTQGAGRRT